MKRRDFLNITIPATGAILMTAGPGRVRAMAEINRQFAGKPGFDEYDIVVNGAGLSGYFTAIHAARQKKKVLVVDRHTSPGYDLAAKGRLWIGAEGFDKTSDELKRLFLPEGEKVEITNKGGGYGNSLFGDEVLLFSGSIRKGMLRNLILNNVDVLLMTDACGVVTSHAGVHSILLAGKHGLHLVKTRAFVDASDQAIFSRGLFNSPGRIVTAGFVLELTKVKSPEKKTVSVSDEFGISGNSLRLHRGKASPQQLFIEYEFPVRSQNIEDIENQSRLIAASIGKKLHTLDPSLEGAEITHLPVETFLTFDNDSVRAKSIEGYHVAKLPEKDLTFTSVIELESACRAMVSDIRYPQQSSPVSVLTIGAQIPYADLKVSTFDEPGLRIPLKTVTFDFQRLIGNRQECQVLVAGGGTGGAFAALGAAERGANTIVVDYFNDLGGTKTMGGVMGYYHGVRDNKYFKKQNEEAERVAFESNMSKKSGRKLYHLTSLLDAGGRIVSGAIMCDAVVADGTVKGIVICRNGKLEVINANVTIDATGDGDVAAFAGAEYEIGNTRTGETQNYSQWDISGGAKLPSPTNRDYDIIDNTRVSELQRGLFISHYESYFYDFHPMLTVRESRRITGMYVLNFIDVAEKTHFHDMIALASSDFDPHNVGSSEYSKCGFLLPHSNDLVLEVPYRCIVPKTLDGLLISGRGISQTHNALQFTRMTADIIVLGYLTGHIAADLASKNIKPRDYDVSELQQYWARIGYLPADYNRKSTWGKWNDMDEITERVKNLALGKPEYLFEVVRLPKEKALPVLAEHYNESASPAGRILLAKAMAWFGNPEGNDVIEGELEELFALELKEGYPNGYIDDYDFIRGREKNVLEGVFWKINQNIGLLAMSGNGSATKTVKHILDNTRSGGGMVMRTNDYYNHRIDLKIIPFYNRILNLCFYAERLPDASLTQGFEKLLTDKNVGGFKTEDYSKVRWRVFGGLLEVSIASAMARCGGKRGYELLVDYLNDTHYTFKTFAASELKELTGDDKGYDTAAWKQKLAALRYPRPVKRLVKEVEV